MILKEKLRIPGNSSLQKKLWHSRELLICNKEKYSILGKPQIQNRKNSGILVRSGLYPRAPANASTRRILLQANGCSDNMAGGILDHHQPHKHSWKNATSNAHMASTLVTLITHTASPSHNKSPNSRSFWHFVKHLTRFPDFLQLLSSDFVARSRCNSINSNYSFKQSFYSDL
jgi:hypothetical protein